MSAKTRHNRPDDALAVALAAGHTLRDAAAAAAISERTATRRWADPGFRQRVDDLRADMVNRATGKMADGMAEAANVLRKDRTVPIQFFNFGNDETFHFFKWVSESGQVTPATLIATAYHNSEAPDDEHLEDEDICVVARNRLAGLLADLLEETTPVGDFTGGEQEHEIGNVWNSPESLWKPIFASALSRIDCHAVAEAMLIQAGKWTPSKELPEIL
jgi:hypothetical protein